MNIDQCFAFLREATSTGRSSRKPPASALREIEFKCMTSRTRVYPLYSIARSFQRAVDDGHTAFSSLTMDRSSESRMCSMSETRVAAASLTVRPGSSGINRMFARGADGVPAGYFGYCNWLRVDFDPAVHRNIIMLPVTASQFSYPTHEFAVRVPTPKQF